MNEPTPDDLARNLAQDLADLSSVDHGHCANILLWTIAPAAIRRALAAEAEVVRLRAIVQGLADRVAAQSDLLSRRAEKKSEVK